MFGAQNETNKNVSHERTYFIGNLKVALALDTNQNQENRNQDSNLKSEIRNLKSPRSAFTLTELLVVITIIAVLASLTIGAAMRALDTAKQTGITTELQQIGAAMEDFKNEFGAYPPNAMINISGPSASHNTLAQADFVRMFKKAFPRHKEPASLILALAGGDAEVAVNESGIREVGMDGAQALYFWLGGFSKDASYPISGPGGPSFVKGSTSGEILEDRQQRYEFDLGRLGPRTNDTFSGRYIEYVDPQNSNRTRRINLWHYTPAGATTPMVYFDTSRHKPEQYDLPILGNNSNVAELYAIKQPRQGIAAPVSNDDIRFVEDKKFQILHAGTDDAWGDGFAGFRLNIADDGVNAYKTALLAPEGPFIGEIADTLGNFMEGTLEDKQE